jgi:hypothetical protein
MPSISFRTPAGCFFEVEYGSLQLTAAKTAKRSYNPNPFAGKGFF